MVLTLNVKSVDNISIYNDKISIDVDIDNDDLPDVIRDISDEIGLGKLIDIFDPEDVLDSVDEETLHDYIEDMNE